MSLLWAVPPVALAIGAAVVLVHLYGMTQTVDELNAQLIRLGEVRSAVAKVREESAAVRETLGRLREP